MIALLIKAGMLKSRAVQTGFLCIYEARILRKKLHRLNNMEQPNRNCFNEITFGWSLMHLHKFQRFWDRTSQARLPHAPLAGNPGHQSLPMLAWFWFIGWSFAEHAHYWNVLKGHSDKWEIAKANLLNWWLIILIQCPRVQNFKHIMFNDYRRFRTHQTFSTIIRSALWRCGVWPRPGFHTNVSPCIISMPI